MARVRQTFPRPRVGDLRRAVAEGLDRAAPAVARGDTVAIGAGSRGIADVDVAVGATVRWLQDRGARPFVIPAMGSHGGGTAEGQRAVLAQLGITEATMGCPVRATMEVVQVGEALGMPIWLDRDAAGADHVGVVNRVKPHTDFKGAIESGLFKMMTIGLGKHQGAAQYHRMMVHHGYEKVITEIGRALIAGRRLAFGVGLVENAYDETAAVGAFTADTLAAGEPALLETARALMARLPFSPIDVLVVEAMGKDVSGAGMDSNVVGRPGSPNEPFPADPRIGWIVVLDLTPASDGNATGIGSADFTTRRLVDKIDMKVTLVNCLAACVPGAAKIPPAYESDREAVEAALSCLGLTEPAEARVIRIADTLRLGEVEVSEALLPDVAMRPDLAQLGEPAPLGFDDGGRLLPLFR